MQQKFLLIRESFSLLARMFRLALSAVTQASCLSRQIRYPCRHRDEQAGKPARHFRLEAEVTLWLKRAGVSSSMKLGKDFGSRRLRNE